MPLSDLPRTPGVMKLVDAIPSDCGNRKRRRPTGATEQTEHCSDDDLTEIIVTALSEDSQSDCGEDYADQHSGTLCSSPPALDMEDVLDLSTEKLLRGSSFSSTSSSRLAALLEENQRALQMLLAKEEAVSNAQHTTGLSSSTKTRTFKHEAWHFELQQSLPGVVALILYCVAHASTYELVSNLAYEAVEKAPNDDGTYARPWSLYTAMLLLGCLLARFSGLVWNFTGPLAYERVKLIYHNRVRLGARDARWLHSLQQQGESVLGIVHLVAYYLCYISVVFFVGQLAMYCDQREEILGELPSALYQGKLASMADAGISSLQNGTAAASPLACLHERDELEIFGPEDDLYFFHTLSKNSYDHFFGQDYETALFDSTHQILFHATLAATAIYALKQYLSFSFWAGW